MDDKKNSIDLTGDEDLLKTKWSNISLSDQGVAALISGFQKCLLEQTDIVPMLRGFVFARHMDTNELHVLNPPTNIKVENEEPDEVSE